MKNQLLRYRLKALLTQEKLAKKSGVSLKTIQNIENGNHKPSGLTKYKIANALEVDPEDIFGPLEETED